MEITHPKAVHLQTILQRLIVSFNVGYLLAFFMFAMSFAIEIAPLDPLVRYMNAAHDYAPTALQYILLLFAALMYKAAPSRNPLSTLLATPLAFLYIMAARFIMDTNFEFSAVGTPWLSLGLVYISVALVHLMLLGTFVFTTLYKQVEECEANRQRSEAAGGTH